MSDGEAVGLLNQNSASESPLPVLIIKDLNKKEDFLLYRNELKDGASSQVFILFLIQLMVINI